MKLLLIRPDDYRGPDLGEVLVEPDGVIVKYAQAAVAGVTAGDVSGGMDAVASREPHEIGDGSAAGFFVSPGNRENA